MMQSENNQYIETLYRKYFRRVQLYAKSMVQDDGYAEEIAQDVFHLAYCKISEVQKCDDPMQWLHLAARNVSRNYLKRQARYCKRVITVEDTALTEIPSSENVENEVIDALEYIDIVKRGRTADERLRSILTEDEFALYCRLILNNEPYIVVAKAFGISVWACQKRWQRARKKIYEEFYGKGHKNDE